MAVQLNHTIVLAKDKQASASFLAELLGLPEPTPFGPFLAVAVDNGVTLDFLDHDGEIAGQHYAFLVTETEFDAIFARITEHGLTYFSDPHGQHPGQINTNDGGRGVYFADADGHNLEVITRPYGSGGE